MKNTYLIIGSATIYTYLLYNQGVGLNMLLLNLLLISLLLFTHKAGAKCSLLAQIIDNEDHYTWQSYNIARCNMYKELSALCKVAPGLPCLQSALRIQTYAICRKLPYIDLP